MRFRDKLAHATRANQSLLCVGLDPDPDRLPTDDVAEFLCEIVRATSDLVCAFKPNLAFYEQLGERGYATLQAVLRSIPDHIPVIGDAKRGDVPNTSSAYARALFDELGLDAITVNPYLGGDALAPFLERDDRGIFVLCRTSNAGARDLQDLEVTTGGGSRPLYEAVAELAKGWDGRGNVGLVVGATYPAELRRMRDLCPEMPILMPGVGAQEGDLAAAVEAGLDANGAGIIVSSSRSILYASDGADFAQAAHREAQELRRAIETCRLAAQSGPHG
jgi:orotidine-5'-phosphate decarboxylase